MEGIVGGAKLSFSVCVLMLVCNERQSSTCSSVASVYLPYKEEAAMVIQRFMRDRWRSRPGRVGNP